MTDQECKLERLAAWDRFEQTKTDFLACKSRLQSFREGMRPLYEKLLVDVLDITDGDIGVLPMREKVLEAYQEFAASRSKYESALQQARNFKWPVTEADEPAALCHDRPRR